MNDKFKELYIAVLVMGAKISIVDNKHFGVKYFQVAMPNEVSAFKPSKHLIGIVGEEKRRKKDANETLDEECIYTILSR